jgi:molybdopterin molybdotransferase
MSSDFAFQTPDDAVAALITPLRPLPTESVSWQDAAGRVLAEALRADRDSPPADVSSMDGYALRREDLSGRRWPVAGDILIGQLAPPLPAGSALRIVTGACVPANAAAVVPREDVEEQADQEGHVGQITLRAGSIAAGQYIRRRGENLAAAQEVLVRGTLLHAPAVAALAAFGLASPRVHQRVRASVLTTGDEVLPPDATPQPWQIRDSNGPALHALLAECPLVRPSPPRHIPDDVDRLNAALRNSLDQSELVLLTGGVSMGQRDYVPDLVRSLGARILFHRLPIRPGKPILAAIAPAGQVILGLPGNPVSVLVTACRFAGAAIRALSGLPPRRPASVLIDAPDDSRIALWWSRPAQKLTPDSVRLVPSQGSGDLVAAARSDGFVEIPPQRAGPGPWPSYSWAL